jgi:hypothetical protein
MSMYLAIVYSFVEVKVALRLSHPEVERRDGRSTYWRDEIADEAGNMVSRGIPRWPQG